MTHASMRVMTHTRDAPGDRHDTLSRVTGRSGRGTARQTIRIDEDLWDDFDEAARKLGTDRSTWIRDAVRWCVGRPNAPTPARPEPDSDDAA
ncbi:ribbon-helix-helix domain-containing protein [Actinoplanes sp. CA-142083]|uniref:ribbon-helix-helix domain-containing protein n=1 Tax=Actinoplanes sp. CA-142083 TaxID=3239903 RepID=UPI003D94BDA3